MKEEFALRSVGRECFGAGSWVASSFSLILAASSGAEPGLPAALGEAAPAVALADVDLNAPLDAGITLALALALAPAGLTGPFDFAPAALAPPVAFAAGLLAVDELALADALALVASPLGGRMRGACHCISGLAAKAGRQSNSKGTRRARMSEGNDKDKRG